MILELVSAQGPKRQMNVFAVALFAWSCQSATVGASDPRTVAGQKKEHELVETLASAEVATPQLVARVLHELILAPAELGQLDSVERAEFVDSMRGAGVPLGDRFRVRRMSDILRTSGQVHSDYSIFPASSSETKMDAFQGSSRALQSEGSSGVSGDSIALMVTALLGIGSFIVQAVTEKRAARAATATQKELDRELAAREASRNIAAVQLDRVRLQMGEVLPGRCSTRPPP